MSIVHKQMDMLNIAGTREESDYLFAEELMRGSTAHKAALMVTEGDMKALKHSASRRGVPAIVRNSHEKHGAAGGLFLFPLVLSRISLSLLSRLKVQALAKVGLLNSPHRVCMSTGDVHFSKLGYDKKHLVFSGSLVGDCEWLVKIASAREGRLNSP